jgi:type II secretory pathway component PulC
LTLTIGELNLLAGGDIIVEMLGLPIIPDPRVLNDVQQRLNQLRAGDQLQVKILRGGKMMDLTTVIAP